MKHNARVEFNMAKAGCKRCWMKDKGSLLKSICPLPVLVHAQFFKATQLSILFIFCSPSMFVWYTKNDSCGISNKQCHYNLSFLHAWLSHLWWRFGKVIGFTWPAVRQHNEGQKDNTHDTDWNGLQSYIPRTALQQADSWLHIAATPHRFCFLIKPAVSSLCKAVWKQKPQWC